MGNEFKFAHFTIVQRTEQAAFCSWLSGFALPKTGLVLESCISFFR